MSGGLNANDAGDAIILLATEFPKLDTADFRRLWLKWLGYRRSELRKKVLARTQRMHLKKLNEMGEVRAMVAIRHSRDHGWVGIFEPGNRNDKYVETSARIR